MNKLIGCEHSNQTKCKSCISSSAATLKLMTILTSIEMLKLCKLSNAIKNVWVLQNYTEHTVVILFWTSPAISLYK